MTDTAFWRCPYCGRDTTLTDPQVTSGSFRIDLENSEHGEDIGLSYSAISCPNEECTKVELYIHFHKGRYIAGQKFREWTTTDLIESWKLLPESSAKPQPDCIPRPLRDDYTEACRIADLSPKASATLARRCLQGMIRDFWETPKKPNLKQEIEAIKDKVDPLTWRAIDSVRGVGNVGAHMERDINLIVDVEPKEAKLLVGLIETLFREWYVHREEREERMNALIGLAENKEQDRKSKPEAPEESDGEIGERST